MNDGAGNHEFVKASAAQLIKHFTQSTPEVRAAISMAARTKTESEIEQHRIELLASFTEVRNKAVAEVPQGYVHYASRFDIVGVYQSVLSTVFGNISSFQGYGNRNPIWVTTLLEQGAFKLESFFHQIHEIQGTKKSLLQAIVEAWKEIRVAKAPYPVGLPTTLPFDETCTIALLADWGGDNPAAKRVAHGPVAGWRTWPEMAGDGLHVSHDGTT